MSTTISKKKRGQQLPDILEIDTKIKELFEQEHANIPVLQTEIARFEWIATNSTSTVERKLALTKCKGVQEQLKLIQTGYREAKYLLDSTPIIDDYKKILDKPIEIDFMKNTTTDRNCEKRKIIIQYINIAKDYYPMSQLQTTEQDLICEPCGVKLMYEDEFLYICPKCGAILKQFASMASYNEATRINTTQRYIYDKRIHFSESMKKFQSKQNTTISEQVYKDLQAKIASHNISIDTLTKIHLFEFLKLTGHTGHYEDINLIYHEITKKPAHDISHLEPILLENFDSILEEYEHIKQEGRTNFLNGQYVLFQLLSMHKYPCTEDDFYVLKTREKMLEHDNIWKKICTKLNWPFRPTV